MRGVTTVGEHRDNVRVIDFKFGSRLLGHLGYLGGRAINTVHHQRNGSRKIRRDARVEFKLGGTARRPCSRCRR